VSEPLSCVKCGGPRTVSICAYCGTRYASEIPEVSTTPQSGHGDLLRERLRLECERAMLDQQYAQYGLYAHGVVLGISGA